MYPLRINLITEEKKNRLIRTAQLKFIQNILQVLLLSVSLVAIILLVSENLLQKYFTNIAENSVNVSSRYTSQSNEISTINKLTKRVTDVQAQYHEITPIIMAMASSTPEGINLNSLNISYAKKTISFSGMADTRQIFLNFQEMLENNPLLSNVESPVSDLTKKENIAFNISAKLK